MQGLVFPPSVLQPHVPFVPATDNGGEEEVGSVLGLSLNCIKMAKHNFRNNSTRNVTEMDHTPCHNIEPSEINGKKKHHYFLCHFIASSLLFAYYRPRVQ